MGSKHDTSGYQKGEKLESHKTRDNHPDPLSGAPGAHPVATGLGAVAGGAAGIMAGAAIGAATTGPAAPIGAFIGAVVGAVGGGYAGKGIAEKIDPTAKTGYWRENYKDRPNVKAGVTYDKYQPAYQYGVEARIQHPGQSWDDVHDELQRGWNQRQGVSALSWDQAEDTCYYGWTHGGGPSDTGTSHGQQPGAV